MSLFGYDLKADHQALVSGDPLRANWKLPEESLILLKPTLAEYHEGGKRFELDGPEYKLLLEWVRNRAPGVALRDADLELERLTVTPDRYIIADNSSSVPIRVTAYWNDGSTEDVTPFTRLEVKDDSIAQLAPGPTLSRVRSGSTHLIAYYDRSIASAPVIAPIETNDAPFAPAPTAGVSAIDSLINAKLNDLGIAPTPVCGDEEFLRRVSLDLTGALPDPEEILAFCRDPSPSKRTKKIDELLTGTAHKSFWTHWLSDLVGNRSAALSGSFPGEQSRLWYQWTLHRVSANMPYDELAYAMIRGVGRRPGQSFQEYCEETTASIRPGGESALVERDSIPYFWERSNVVQPQSKALAFSYVFLGVKLQCAECHKHPFDRWTKEDFEGMKAFFEPLRHGTPVRDQAAYEKMRFERYGESQKPTSTPRKEVEAGHTIPWSEIYLEPSSSASSKFRNIPLQRAADIPQPLEKLVEWLNDPAHPYLAVTYVNRVWSHYFGAGVVEPADDLNLANPPINRELLDYLTAGFIEHDYDMQWLHREIVSSDAYQRSWQSPDRTPLHCQQFASRTLRRIPAEVLHDAILMATASDEERRLLKSTFTARMIGPSGRGDGDGSQFLAKFGRPQASAVCERTRSDSPNLGQALLLQNNSQIERWLDRPTGWIAQLQASAAASGDDTSENREKVLANIVQQCYLRTLSRLPDNEEEQIAAQSLQQAENIPAGARTLLWSLINVKEFSVNH